MQPNLRGGIRLCVLHCSIGRELKSTLPDMLRARSCPQKQNYMRYDRGWLTNCRQYTRSLNGREFDVDTLPGLIKFLEANPHAFAFEEYP